LQRLKTDHLDLYRLHWHGPVSLAETVEGMEALVRAGKIRKWGVSNFDYLDVAAAVPHRRRALRHEQILYNVTERGVAFDRLPQLSQHHIPTLAYSPVGVRQAARRDAVPGRPGLGASRPHGHRHPKAGDGAHVNDNVRALDPVLTAEDLAAIDASFPPPKRKTRLAML
jgi:diketogulonate reductase-like aldo/keto reductase